MATKFNEIFSGYQTPDAADSPEDFIPQITYLKNRCTTNWSIPFTHSFTSSCTT